MELAHTTILFQEDFTTLDIMTGPSAQVTLWYGFNLREVFRVVKIASFDLVFM